MNSPESSSEDFPFDLIMRKARDLDSIEEEDDKILDCAIYYFDAKYINDKKAIEQAQKILKQLLK